MKKLFFPLLLLVFMVPFVYSAIPTDTLVVAYGGANFDNCTIDWVSNENLSMVGTGALCSATSRVASGSSIELINSNTDYWTTASAPTGLPTGSDDRTVCYWLNPDTTTSFHHINNWGTSSANTAYGLYTDGTTPTYYGSSSDIAFSSSTLGVGTWDHICYAYDGTDVILYFNGVNTNNGSKSLSTTSTVLRFGVDVVAAGSNLGDGKVDLFKIWNETLTAQEILDDYNSGAGCDYSCAFPGGGPGVALETVPKASSIVQTGTVTINSPSYSTIVSGTAEVTKQNEVYAQSVMTIFDPVSSNNADCQITIDGNSEGSMASRTLSPGAFANINLMTNNVSLAPGNYTVALQCKRSGGGGAFSVGNSTIVFIDLTTTDQRDLETVFGNFSTALSPTGGLLDTFQITTSENNTAGGSQRSIVVDWSAEYVYGATGIINTTVEIAGTNCSTYNRYGTSGSTGSVGGTCLMKGYDNSTTYTINVNGVGTGSVNAKYHIFELIHHNNEAHNADLTGLTITNQTLDDLTFTNLTIEAGHGSNANVLVRAGLTIVADTSDTSNVTLQIQNSQNTSLYKRTVNLIQPGAMVLETLATGVSGTETLTLFGSCASQNCTIKGGSMVAFITDESPLEPNSFNIKANNTYNGLFFNNFDVLLDDNTTFTTNSGNITLFSVAPLINLTFPASNNTNPKYFETIVTNHNTSENLTVELRPWTEVFAITPDSQTINNFSVNYTDGVFSETFVTTNGVVYLPLSAKNYTVTVYDATGDDGTDYAINDQELNLTDYLRNLTFNMQVTNSIDIEFYDEITGSLIDDRNITLEYISLSQSGNDTTDNGQMFISLLSPDSYTLRYAATGYGTRFYYFTLINNTFNALNLTMLSTTDGPTNVTVTLKDTLDNLISGANIKVAKYDVFTNDYILQQIRATNFEGQTVFDILLDSEFYRFTVEINGEVVKITNPSYIYGNSLTLIVDLISGAGFEKADSYEGYQGNISFLENTDEFLYVYNDVSNTASNACLYVYQLKRTGKTLHNSTCSTSPNGALYASALNTTGAAYFAEGWITDSGGVPHLVASASKLFGDQIPDDQGMGMFLLFFMIGIIGAIGVWKIEVAVVLASLAPLLFSIAGFVQLSFLATIPIMVLGFITAYVIGVKS